MPNQPINDAPERPAKAFPQCSLPVTPACVHRDAPEWVNGGVKCAFRVANGIAPHSRFDDAMFCWQEHPRSRSRLCVLNEGPPSETDCAPGTVELKVAFVFLHHGSTAAAPSSPCKHSCRDCNPIESFSEMPGYVPPDVAPLPNLNGVAVPAGAAVIHFALIECSVIRHSKDTRTFCVSVARLPNSLRAQQIHDSFKQMPADGGNRASNLAIAFVLSPASRED